MRVGVTLGMLLLLSGSEVRAEEEPRHAAASRAYMEGKRLYDAKTRNRKERRGNLERALAKMKESY